MGRSFGGSSGGGGGGFSGGGRGGGFSGGGGRSFGGGGSFGGGRSFGGPSGGPSFGGPAPGGFNHHGGHHSGLLEGMLLGSLLTRRSSGPEGSPPGGQPPRGPQNNRSGCLSGCLIAALVIVIVLILGMIAFNGVSCSSTNIDASTVEREVLPSSAVQETDYYTDEGGWITSSSTLETGMRHFYEKTGVQPYLYILANGTTTSIDELTEQAEELYSELFSDEGHFLVVFCDDGNGSYSVGYYIGAQAESVLDDEAITIFAQYLNLHYYDTSISDEEVFSDTYTDTADRIMKVTTSPLVIIAVCIAVIVVVVAVVFIVRYRTKAKAEEQRRQQQILNTPLEEFGDTTLDDLERKYTQTSSSGNSSCGQTEKD